MGLSAWHADVTWCSAGAATIMYHANISVSQSVNYDEQTVFGSHGMYAVWTGTDPRQWSVSADMVAANSGEAGFNVGQVAALMGWAAESPPSCQQVSAPAGAAFNGPGRILSWDGSVSDGVHLTGGIVVQVSLSTSIKECKAI